MRPVTQRTPVEVNSWNKGLITEASPINFPEGASVDEENFVIDRNGSRARRYGIDYEADYALTVLAETTASVTGVAIHNYIWENVNENPDSNYLVHQYGNKLYFYNAVSSNVSANSMFGGSAISLTATSAYRFSFASIQGFLVISVGDKTLRVINAESTASYSISFLNLKVRDFWGVDDSLDVEERTSSLSPLHAYNLYNQGWPAEFFCSTDPANPNTINNGTVTDPVQVTFSETGNYPSNADILYTAMTFLTNGRKAYYPHALVNIVSGNTPAPNGHYIIDLFNRGQGRIDTYQADQDAGWPARVNYTSSIPTDQSTGGIKAVAAYAGRIFYACSAGETGGDSKSPHVGTFVLFSQLVDNIEDLEKCYQEADPTAEDISDIIATDGGYIQLPNIVNTKALVPFKNALLVFADNGVWSITGGTQGFTATEYESSYLTNNGVLSPESIVVTEDQVLYWSRSGIFMISAETNATVTTAGSLNVVSLTRQTIQTLYNNIPYNSKKVVVGLYDDVDSRVRWLYQSTYDASMPYRFTHELILDTTIPAWYKFAIKDISTRTPRISGYVNVPPIARDAAATNYKYSILGQDTSSTYVLTAGWMKNTSFLDWYTAGSGTDAAAYLITGYVTGGDSARTKSMPWLTVHLLRERAALASESTVTSTTTATTTESAPGAFSGVLLLADEYRHLTITGNEVGVTIFSVYGSTSVTAAAAHVRPYKVVNKTGYDFRNYYATAFGVSYLPPKYTVETWANVFTGATNTVGMHLSFMGISGTQSDQWNRFAYVQKNLVKGYLTSYAESTGAVNVEQSTTYTVAPSSSAFSKYGQYAHFCIERDGHSFKCYVDGEEVASMSLSASLSTSAATTFTIGQTSFDGLTAGTGWTSFLFNGGFSGYVDSCRITKDAVVYGGNFTPPQRLLDKWRCIYHFDETVGAVSATSMTMWSYSSSSPATLSASGSAAISTTQKKFGTASLRTTGGYFVTGTRRYLSVGQDPFTFDMWIYPELSFTAGTYMMDLRGEALATSTAIWAPAIRGLAGNFVALQYGVSTMFTSTESLTLNTFHHIACDRDSDNVLRFYVNGTLVGSATVTVSYGPTNGSKLFLGSSNLAGSGLGPYHGYIDEVRFGLHTAAYAGTSFTPRTTAYPDRGLPGK